LSTDSLSTNDPCSWTTREVQKAIRVVRAGIFESSAVSNSNRLPDEQPFIASAVQIQRIVRGIATRKRVAKVLEKQRKNREKRKTRQQNKKKKGKKKKAVRKTSSLISELMALETPTQICEVQTTSAPQNCLPSVWGTHILRPSGGVMDLSVAYLAHDLLSGFYGQKCCDKSNRGM
jgi:hypothetical protein